ncbi:MAG: hypothetical protein Q9166_006200 [cf. Caloplaca sp. 2 TL-2023]
MADTEPPKHPVDLLEPTLALVLKETGKFFLASHSSDSRQVGLAKIAISQAIPAANLRFHDALDDIETEIIRAKSVFERDLSSIRTKRAERERAAAGIVKTRSPNGIVKSSTPKGSPKVATTIIPLPAESEAQQKPEATASDKVTEIPVAEGPVCIEDQKPSLEKDDTNTDTVITEPFSIPQSLPKDPDEPKGLAISLDQAPSGTEPAASTKPESREINTVADVPVQTNDMPPDLSNADFESMFEDPDLGANDEIDFDLAFPNESANDPSDLLDASAFTNIPMDNLANIGTQNNATASEDLTTLLPGLENYVNDNNDFQLPNLSGSNILDNSNDNNATNAVNIPTTTEAGDDQKQQAQAANAPITESSFEDMFGLGSYMDGTGDDELGGTGNMGEVGDFDEDWFNTDGM